MATRTITVHDRCTKEGCRRVLMSIAEGERGLCGACTVASWTAEQKASMARLVAVGLKPGATDAEKEAAVSDAIKYHGKDKESCRG